MTSKGIEAVLLAGCDYLEDLPTSLLQQEKNQVILSKLLLFNIKSNETENSGKNDWEDKFDDE